MRRRIHASVSTAKSWLVSAEQAIRMFAYRAGLRIVSATADIDIQALDRSIMVLAKVDITQTANRITLTAKESVTFNGGGSSTRWDAGGIKDSTTGGHTVRAASHRMAGPKCLPVPETQFPRGELNPPSRQDAASPVSL